MPFWETIKACPKDATSFYSYLKLVAGFSLSPATAAAISAGVSGLWTRVVYGIIVVVSVSIYALIQKKSNASPTLK